MATRWARFVRGWVAAVFSTFIAILSHTLGGGTAPGALAVVVSLAFAGIVCIGLCGRSLSVWRVSASVVISQLIFHGLFSLGAPEGALGVETAGAAAFAGTPFGAHQHAAIEFAQGVAGSAAAHGHAGSAMWFAHGIAAVATVIALRHGEAAFWGLLITARMIVQRIAPAAAVITPPAPLWESPACGLLFLPRDLALVLSAMWHRGPPRVHIVA
jgi:hypothetical protein